MEKAQRKQIDEEWRKKKIESRNHNLALLGVNHLSLKTILKIINRKRPKQNIKL